MERLPSRALLTHCEYGISLIGVRWYQVVVAVTPLFLAMEMMQREWCTQRFLTVSIARTTLAGSASSVLVPCVEGKTVQTNSCCVTSVTWPTTCGALPPSWMLFQIRMIGNME